MSEVVEVKLAEISKRFFSRDYPFYSLFILHGSIILMSMGFRPQSSLLDNIIGSQASILLAYLHITIPLFLIKPTNQFIRFTIIIISVFISVGFIMGFDAYINNFYPVPFSSSSIATQMFLLNILTGIYVIWFFLLEERQCISEKRIHNEKEKRITNEKKVVESHLKLLQAQIEPHFLFNTLTSIVSLDDTDPQNAKDMQINFIQYLKATLAKTRASVTTIAQEIELIRAYLDIFKVRMGDRLDYTIDVSGVIKDLPFPSMLIQPIVENAIKHGLEPKIEGGSIFIKAARINDTLHWEITDTGLGLSDQNELGIGISNIIERIESLYGDDGQLIMEENQPCGLKVIVEVPYV